MNRRRSSYWSPMRPSLRRIARFTGLVFLFVATLTAIGGKAVTWNQFLMPLCFIAVSFTSPERRHDGLRVGTMFWILSIGALLVAVAVWLQN